jgi:hypothetical protein
MAGTTWRAAQGMIRLSLKHGAADLRHWWDLVEKAGACPA